MNQDLFLAYTIPALCAIAAPMILSYINGRQLRVARQEEYAERRLEIAEEHVRQDEVADRLWKQQHLVSAKVEEVSVRAAANAKEARSQLKQIHTLVNNDMTAARQAELDAKRDTLAALKRIVTAAQRNNEPVNTRDLEEIAANEQRIQELEGILADRLAQLRLVDAEILSSATANRDAKIEEERDIARRDPTAGG